MRWLGRTRQGTSWKQTKRREWRALVAEALDDRPNVPKTALLEQVLGGMHLLDVEEEELTADFEVGREVDEELLVALNIALRSIKLNGWFEEIEVVWPDSVRPAPDVLQVLLEGVTELGFFLINEVLGNRVGSSQGVLRSGEVEEDLDSCFFGRREVKNALLHMLELDGLAVR